jgi:hypothetical protein
VRAGVDDYPKYAGLATGAVLESPEISEMLVASEISALFPPLVPVKGGPAREYGKRRRCFPATMTNRHVIGVFLNTPIAVEDAENRNVVVRVGSVGGL